MGNPVTYKSNLLSLIINEDENSIVIKWMGKSADRTPGIFINPILNEALEKSSNNNKELIMNFTELEFLNSSTVAPIVKILDRTKRGTNKLTIEYSKSLNWQELSFSALIVFQTKDNRIQIKGI